MKKHTAAILNLAFILFVGVYLPSAIFGQAKPITKEEFRKEIDKASGLTETTFPRRETEVKPNKIIVYMEGQREPAETVLNEVKLKEFQSKEAIRYQFTKVTTKGKSITKRVEIDSICYDSDGRKWSTKEISCDMVVYSLSGGSVKEEFFVESVLIDSKPAFIFRVIKTGETYSDGKPPYVDEHTFYVDPKGLLIKSEHLTRRGNSQSTLQSSVNYEYDFILKPIEKPLKKHIKKRRKIKR